MITEDKSALLASGTDNYEGNIVHYELMDERM